MNETEESKILVAIAKLETNYKHLDEDMKNVVLKIDECTKRNFQYMMTTLLATVAAVFGWALLLRGVI